MITRSLIVNHQCPQCGHLYVYRNELLLAEIEKLEKQVSQIQKIVQSHIDVYACICTITGDYPCYVCGALHKDYDDECTCTPRDEVPCPACRATDNALEHPEHHWSDDPAHYKTNGVR